MIKHEKSAPYSPHQNGTAERSWRTLFEMARSLLLQSKLPKSLWTYAVMAATHIRNRCYSQRIKDTPYGVITGIKPDVSKLHIFGSTCYSYVQNPKKLDARSKKGIFVGYDRNSPSYLVYNPDTKTVSKNRIVKFADAAEPWQTDAEDEPLPVTEEPPVRPDTGTKQQSNVKEPAEQPEPRRNPTRDRQPPIYLREYEVDGKLADYVKSVDYCYHINIHQSYHEAVTSPEAVEWTEAMENELTMLNVNETYEVTDLPPERSAVGGRWVFDLRGDPENPRYKARYVARGYSQTEGVDYFETFSPTARMDTVRTLIQVGCQQDLLLHQMDVKSAFLHAPIEEEIFVKEPEGYSTTPNKVWKLNKSLYGLKQSGRNWNTTLEKYLTQNGFTKSKADPCLFTKSVNGEVVHLLVWVDDIIIAASNQKNLDETKTLLCEKFDMKDLGELKYFLGIQF